MHHPSTTPPRWHTEATPFTEAQAAAVRRYEALTHAERDRARRLIVLTGCSLDLACAAVEATRAAV